MPFIFIFFSNAHITLTPFTLITNSFYLPLSLSVANTLRSVYLHETGTSCLTTHTQSLLKHILSLSLFLSFSLSLFLSVSLSLSLLNTHFFYTITFSRKLTHFRTFRLSLSLSFCSCIFSKVFLLP